MVHVGSVEQVATTVIGVPEVQEQFAVAVPAQSIVPGVWFPVPVKVIPPQVTVRSIIPEEQLPATVPLIKTVPAPGFPITLEIVIVQLMIN